MSNIGSIYHDGTYLAENPDWDRKDAPWKAAQVVSILFDNEIKPSTVCEVGCGSGDVLVHLQKALPSVKMTGFDISPHTSRFWAQHNEAGEHVEFYLGNFHEINRVKYDVLLMLDVFEHIPDPFSFLENCRQYAEHFVFHIPLDLSAISVMRGYPLIYARKKTGHLHYYTKDLALSTIIESGYEVLEWRYTGASLNAPNRSLKTRLMAFPRKLACALNRDFGVRLFGGETLLVLAKPSTTICTEKYK